VGPANEQCCEQTARSHGQRDRAESVWGRVVPPQQLDGQHAEDLGRQAVCPSRAMRQNPIRSPTQL
jgi:hypothetical protein